MRLEATASGSRVAGQDVRTVLNRATRKINGAAQARAGNYTYIGNNSLAGQGVLETQNQMSRDVGSDAERVQYKSPKGSQGRIDPKNSQIGNFKTRLLQSQSPLCPPSRQRIGLDASGRPPRIRDDRGCQHELQQPRGAARGHRR